MTATKSKNVLVHLQQNFSTITQHFVQIWGYPNHV